MESSNIHALQLMYFKLHLLTITLMLVNGWKDLFFPENLSISDANFGQGYDVRS